MKRVYEFRILVFHQSDQTWEHSRFLHVWMYAHLVVPAQNFSVSHLLTMGIICSSFVLEREGTGNMGKSYSVTSWVLSVVWSCSHGEEYRTKSSFGKVTLHLDQSRVSARGGRSVIPIHR
jgi:hypothetical protein